MKLKGIRWWMIGLLTLGMIVNYLARNTLSVAAGPMMKDLNFSTAEYANVVVAWQLCYAFFQPVAGYVLDAVGTKLGLLGFAALWSLACAGAALAMSWQGLAFWRGLLGLTEAAGIPAGVKAATEWFPAKERSVAIGWFNIGSSIGALLAPPLVVWAIMHGSWHWGFLIVGGLGLVWCILWAIFYKHPDKQPLLGDDERRFIVAGQEAKYSEASIAKKGWIEMLSSRNFWSIGIPRILSEPAWQTFNAWIPLYMMTERHMDLKQVAMFAWLPFLAADIGCILGGYLSPFFRKTLGVSWLTSRKLVVLTGSLCMVGPACVGLVESPYSAIALLCVGGFAHQTLSGALYAVTTDLFGKKDVATATGLGGMMGYLGAAAFTAVFGIVVTQIGYSPLFAVLAVFDIVGAIVVFALARRTDAEIDDGLPVPAPSGIASRA